MSECVSSLPFLTKTPFADKIRFSSGFLATEKKRYSLILFSETEEATQATFAYLKRYAPIFSSMSCRFNTKTIDAIASPPPESSFEEMERPMLELPQLPKLSLFICYFMLDKLRLNSESTTYALARDEISEIDADLNATHQQRLERLKKAMEKEKQVEKWGILSKATTLSLSLTGVVSGIALIGTGVGSIAGSLLIISGVLTIASQVMELTGGWHEIAEILPGDDPDKKRAVISWIQIGITVLSLVMAAATFVAGGLWSMKDSMKLVTQAIGGIVSIAQGVVNIGLGVTSYQHKNRIADVKEFDITITKLRALRQDLMELIEEVADRMEKMVEYFGETLAIQREVFIAEQKAWR